MKERPILFSAPMVRALLAGTKTQTRRPVKFKPWQQIEEREDGSKWPWMYDGERDADFWLPCPYGMPGDCLWVRESFQPLFADGVENHWEVDWKTGKGYAISYPATDGIQEYIDADDNLRDVCKPSIHMPRWASRILLEVVSVRVERLQDISMADAIAEGTPGGHGAIPLYPYNATPIEHYFYLWKQINGAESLHANPWVWAVDFKRIKP